MQKIPLIETVPPGYRRIFMLFDDNELCAAIAVDNEPFLSIGFRTIKKPTINEGDVMDWQAVTVMVIRDELQRLDDLNSADLKP